ncbi:SDR family NAD(P)-dependent oxidoreductase [Thermococcus sp. M39]|uniref:SDR family NAD(P)-dependent oxidoreductase n=1 Tax=unclassified Thermococcus TaxID=2627626 RepID=UPI001439ABC1|nr:MULTISPECIES: SDR family NAD(P)-dependent oxidoreductase [unclassified Thermococcus]NJE07223.1 SDR family NAD(P)-dependent oxidoreductase [Thermococcus sp. M39]NJE12645.1 SDR family NAD(P)-dependent oxidoreductase [Thermococcus sp. LS2]
MKNALVTGASGGIGKLIVKRLTEQDYFVIGVGRNEKALRELSSLGNFDYIITDLSEKGAAERIRKALERRGIERLDLLINNAGFAIAKPLLEQNEEELEKLFKVNVIAPIVLTKELLDMIPRGGKVVFVISAAAFVNTVELPSYGAAKASLHYMVVNLEKELKEKDVHIIKVYPRQVATPFWYGKVPKGSVSPEEAVDVILKAIKKNKSEVFVPAYVKLVKYLPRWPVFDYKFKF